MPVTILDRLPYLPDPQLPAGVPPPASQVLLRGQAVRIKRYQVVVWISLAYQGQRSISSADPRVPAILDTGTTHDLIIQEEHLRDWAQIDPGRYRPVNTLAVDAGSTTAHLDVLPYNVWLHRNHPYKR